MDPDSPHNGLELRQDEGDPSSPRGTMADALLEREKEFKPFVRYYDTAKYEALTTITVSTQTEGPEEAEGDDRWFKGLPQSPVPQTKRRKYTPSVEQAAVSSAPPPAEPTTKDDAEGPVAQREKAAHEYSDVVEEELIIDEADLVPEDSAEEFVLVQDDMGRDRRVRPESETYKRYRRITATRRANEAADSGEQSTTVTPAAAVSPVQEEEERPEARQAAAARGVIAYDDL
ncbi:hypothetical protein FOZ60_015622 [Perkinsus olseni]|uniref:Uncharacterized protein n=1 Tax=Perkinsus olseni TaxID=32597 RepID=A0A7J6PMI2_PEROL|nr:hypothetical protein FOZ60_015622 [Perkinsus olseni]